MMLYTVWALWKGRVGVPPAVGHLGFHGVSRELARWLAERFNNDYGRGSGGSGRYLAGRVDEPPPIEAFEK